jgi:hypothetical protein
LVEDVFEVSKKYGQDAEDFADGNELAGGGLPSNSALRWNFSCFPVLFFYFICGEVN